jgi:hypothetical protein
MKEEKEKEKDVVAINIWEGWIKWKKRKKSGTKDVTLLRDETFIFSNHVQSDNEDVIGAL